MNKEFEVINRLAKRAGFRVEENYLPYLNTYPGLAIFGELDNVKEELLDACQTTTEFKILDKLCSKMEETKHITFIPNLQRRTK